MKQIQTMLQVVGLVASLGLSSVLAQDSNTGAGGGEGGGRGGRQGRGGNFNPEQMRERIYERYRESLAIKDDAEWKIVKERIDKVSEARREIPGRGMGAMFGRGGGPGGGGGQGGGGQGGGGQGGGGQGGGRGGFGGDNSPEGDALQKAIDANASADEIKSKLTVYRDAVKAKEAKLEKSQAELRQVLSVKQEAAAVLLGLLK